MRFIGMALAASAIVLGACGGGENKGGDTAAVNKDTAAAVAPAATPATTAAAAPITGTTHEVKMSFDGQNYKFDPADITVKAGDGIKFINVSGGPHNVAFDPATIPADVKGQLMANMANQMAELSGPLLTQPNEAYTISFAGVKPGSYEVHCTPHLAMGMKAKITVQ